MIKKGFKYRNNKSTDVVISILIFPLIVLKKIGDIPYTAVKYLFSKIILIFDRKTFFIGKNKKRVIYKKRMSLGYFLKKIRFPEISIPLLSNRSFKRKLRLFFIKIKYFFLGTIITGAVFFVIFLYFQAKSLPNPSYLSLKDIPATTKIFDRKGRLLYEIYAEENRTPITLSEIPKVVIDATIATEDKEFYSHKGFSMTGILRALVHNSQGENLEGGSTITQQLVRSAFLTPEKTITRKVKELILSFWTENMYSKDQILEMYFNQVPYGGTAWGIEAASQTYFGESVKSLDLSEAAFLAGLPASPTTFSPYGQNSELAKQRQSYVLQRMFEEGFINQKEFDEANSKPLDIKSPRIPIEAPHFVMYVKDILEKTYGQRVVEHSGLRVTTTLDLDLQKTAENIVETNIQNLTSLNVRNGAALITNPQNGEILAMIGSNNYFDAGNQGNFNVVLSKRQPGSSIKVVNFAASLQNGYTASSILEDTPITYKNNNYSSYTPVNYDGRFHGRVTLRQALGSSYNIPAVKVLASVGVKKMVETGKLMGIESWDDDSGFGLSLTLGGGEVTMLDMAKVYGTLANDGIRKDLSPIINITDWKGEELPVKRNINIRAIPEGIAFIISNILADNQARTPAFGPQSALFIPGKTVSVKTGTSDNKRDNWTIGYTKNYVVTVWVGNNDNTPMNPQLTSGVTGAAPIWRGIMDKLLENSEDIKFPVPSDVIGVICNKNIEYFIKGTEPKGCPELIFPFPSPSPSLKFNNQL